MKVVINTKVGGFNPSQQATRLYYSKKGFIEVFVRGGSIFTYFRDPNEKDGNLYSHRDISRHDPVFVDIVEKLGPAANSAHCALKVVEIPDGVDYIVVDCDDGTEYIAEKHRRWE